MELENCDDMRDSRAIESGATGLLKILFPDKHPSEEEFYRFCVNPALEMRQRVRDELSKLDPEYMPVSMRSKYPDHFQCEHRKPQFVDPGKAEFGQVPSEVEVSLDSTTGGWKLVGGTTDGV